MKNRVIFAIATLMCSAMAMGQRTIEVPVPAKGTDATRMLQKAIDQARKNGGKATTIRLSTACYNISRTEGTPLLFHVSNTTTVRENPDPTKHVGLYMKHLRNVTIDGNGARLVTHGEMTTFLMDSCENITLRNFTLTADDPSLPEIRILKVYDKSVEVQCSSDTRYEITPEGKLYWVGHGWRFTGGIAQVYDPYENTSLRTSSPMDNLVKAEELQPGFLKLYYPEHRAMKMHDVYQMRHSLRTEVCGCISRSKNVTLKDIDFNFLGNFGIVGQFSENLTYDHLRCAPAYGSDRTGAGFADFVQMSGCKGKIKIVNSHFEGAHDDPINVHGTHLKVKEWRGKRQAVVRFMHGQTFGFTPFSQGDEVELVSAHSLLPLQGMKVKASQQLDDYEWLLTFDKDICQAAQTEDNVAVENVTWTPEVEICNNYFARIPTRGILVTTRRPVLIEGNTFLRMPMAAILVSDDARSWYESGPAHHVDIRHNKFVECESPIIQLWPENDRYDGPVHRNISITNNSFSFMGKGHLAVKARAVDGLTIEGNLYETTCPTAEMFELTDCTNTKIREN